MSELSLAGLDRWAQAGAHWQVVAVDRAEVTVDFCACTGELVQRIVSTDPVLCTVLARVRDDEAAGPGGLAAEAGSGDA